MARQTPTMAELAQVSADLETFFLPFDASLDLGDRTVYGCLLYTSPSPRD